jgi:hypothetical protein
MKNYKHSITITFESKEKFTKEDILEYIKYLQSGYEEDDCTLNTKFKYTINQK